MNQNRQGFEMRTPPDDQALVAAARATPNGWVYEVDWTYPDDQPTPPEAIRGAWEVGADGRMTGRYKVNERYRPIIRSTRTLPAYMHAGARTNRDQWVVEIDPRGEGAFPAIPPHLVRGWWYVDATGRITDRFRQNSQWIGGAASPGS